jgi:hypothetical protein
VTIYVETLIRSDVEQVWHVTQTPELHARWDLRFTDIRYLPRPDPTVPQRFVYETRIGFGIRIRGEGESVATHEAASGVRTSSLRFWSDDPKSLIRIGSGYWQYVPVAGGVRFLTRYQYQTRFGLLGRVFNSAVFEPLIGWATAWSFDRLRLWLEDGLDPAAAAERSVVHAFARAGLALIWIYQGLVPKLLSPASGELEIMRRTRLFPGAERAAVRLLGGAEIAAGLALVGLWRSRWPFVVQVLALFAFTAATLGASRRLFLAPFNPATLNLAMLTLATIGFVASRKLPSASRCRRRA